MVQESCHNATHCLEFHPDHFFDDFVVKEDDLDELSPPLLLLLELELLSVVLAALT